MFRRILSKADTDEIYRIESLKDDYIDFDVIAENQDTIEPYYPQDKPSFKEVYTQYQDTFNIIQNGIEIKNSSDPVIPKEGQYLPIFYAFVFLEWHRRIKEQKPNDAHYFDKHIQELLQSYKILKPYCKMKTKKYKCKPRFLEKKEYLLDIQIPLHGADTLFLLKWFMLHNEFTPFGTIASLGEFTKIKKQPINPATHTNAIIQVVKNAFGVELVRSPSVKDNKASYIKMMAYYNPSKFTDEEFSTIFTTKELKKMLEETKKIDDL